MAELTERYEKLKKREVETQARLTTLGDLLEKQKAEVKKNLKEAGVKKVAEVDDKIETLEKQLETAITKGEKMFPGGLKATEDEFDSEEL